MPDLVIAVLKWRGNAAENFSEAALAVGQRPGCQVFPVEVKEVEQE